MFDELHHADWSTAASKRWIATARRTPAGWVASGPRPVGPSLALLQDLVSAARSRRVLAGFDFPIGLPASYGILTGFQTFLEALPALGRAAGWEGALEVCSRPDEVSVRRPFYPRTATKGVSRTALTEGIGVGTFGELLRQCERGGPGLRAACSVFWTLGGNQVGRAAISGWRELIRPALEQGAALWPFDGDLQSLNRRDGLVLAETYPADGYAVAGASFSSRESKTSQSDRRSKAASILKWAALAAVDIEDAKEALADGFGSGRNGEDQFDALIGLLAMIAVVDEHRPEATVKTAPEIAAWEGWILGR